MGIAQPDFRHIDMVRELLKRSKPQGQVVLAQDILVIREYDRITVKKGPVPKRENYCYQLVIPGKISIPEAGVNLIATIEDAVHHFSTGSADSPMVEYFDADLLVLPLIVRNYQPGDRFTPLNFCGRKKVQDLLTDRKISRSARRTTPIVLHGKDIVWVVGLQRANFARLTPSTTRVIRLACWVAIDESNPHGLPSPARPETDIRDGNMFE
jgi:tRNA(Ile)-lysidine synthase